MSSENVVEIKGHLYRYEYDQGKTKYLGPVSNAPAMSEQEFQKALNVRLTDSQTHVMTSIKNSIYVPPSKEGEEGVFKGGIVKDDGGYGTLWSWEVRWGDEKWFKRPGEFEISKEEGRVKRTIVGLEKKGLVEIVNELQSQGIVYINLTEKGKIYMKDNYFLGEGEPNWPEAT